MSAASGDPDFTWTSLPDCPDDVDVAGCAVLADGRRVMFSQDMVVDLEPRLRDVASLVLGPSAFDCGGKVVHWLLSRKMPALKHLQIRARPVFTITGPGKGIPRCALRAVFLPNLIQLEVRNVIVDLGPGLCANVRRLRLGLDALNDRGRLPLPAFLAFLRRCQRLEQLYLERYVDTSVLSDAPATPLLSLDGHHHLEAITFADEPSKLSTLLSCLSIPAHIFALRVNVFVGNGSPSLRALHTVLANGRHDHAILREAISLRIGDTADLGALITAQGLNGCKVDFQLLPGDDRPPWALEFRKGGVLFDTLVQSLGLFTGARLQRVEFRGTLSGFHQASWAAVLVRFPTIRDITLWDTPYAADGSLEAFLSALAAPPNAQGRQDVCPNLQRLKIRACIYGHRLTQALVDCLQRREMLGAPRLQLLQLGLFSTKRWSGAERVAFQQAFVPFAAEIKVAILDRGEPQGNILRDAEDWRREKVLRT